MFWFFVLYFYLRRVSLRGEHFKSVHERQGFFEFIVFISVLYVICVFYGVQNFFNTKKILHTIHSNFGKVAQTSYKVFVQRRYI